MLPCTESSRTNLSNFDAKHHFLFAQSTDASFSYLKSEQLRWDLVFEYAKSKVDISSEGDIEAVWKTYLDEISEFMRKMDALPQGTAYRVVIDLENEVEGQSPPDVKGWLLTTKGAPPRVQGLLLGLQHENRLSAQCGICLC